MKSWFLKYRVVVLLPVALYIWLVIQTAWASDDAYITFRSVENFYHGYGPVFNIGERVQTFTHPLWFLLQSLANYIVDLWKDNPFHHAQIYFLNIFISITLSFLTMAFFSLKVASSTRNAVLGILILSTSKAFIDFSTSGLENPLTHIILVVFFWLVLTQRKNSKAQIFYPCLLAALGAVNRLDTIILFLPTIGLLLLQSPDKRNTLKMIGLGLLPLIAWSLFSLFYYGTPFPNTAYAKVNTHISSFSMMQQGIFYFRNSLKLDPITLFIILTALIFGLGFGNKVQKSVMMGVLLYLVYILYIGGDFMSGRYFSSPLLASTAVLTNAEFKSLKSYFISLGIVLIIGVAPLYLIPERSPSFGGDTKDFRVFEDEHGITDERRIYTRYGLGLLDSLKHGAATSDYARENWVYHNEKPVHVELVGPLGLAAYGYGPDVHVIDRNSLSDPLMSRLPLIDPNQWRIGHFRHIIPEGYIQTLQTGENLIVNKNIALYYDKLSFVIRGDLWSWPRIIEIWNLNTGRYDYLLE